MAGQPQHVLVVGAGLGGLRTVEQLRANGYEGRISLVGEEVHHPYDRPPLSKQVLAGDWDPSRATLRAPEAYEDLGVRSYFGTRAVALRPGEVELSDGATLHADAIVVATGVAARTLPGQPPEVHTLRTLDDAVTLRDALAEARSLLVVGAGFIGAEVASTAHARGVEVTVLEALPVPLTRVLGETVGALCGRLLTESGVALRTSVRLERLETADGSVTAVLARDEQLTADVAVVGIGGVPETGWLRDSGIDVANGIPCDAGGRVEGLDGVWAVGDVAAWTAPGSGRRIRNEHWTSTIEQAAAVAAAIAGNEPPPASVPFFWSDQFGMKIQLFGEPGPTDEVLALHGEGLDGGTIKGTVVGFLREGRLVAVAGFGAPRFVARYRPLISSAGDRDAALELARSLG